MSKTFQDLRSYSLLVRQLSRVEIRAEFRRSLLGLGWMVLVPLVAVLVWVLLNQAGILNPGDTEVPYPAYVLLSTSVWGFFAEIYRACSRIQEKYGRLLLMTPFPIITLVAQAVVVHLIRFAIPLFLNVAVLWLFGVRFGLAALLFPFALIPLLLLGTGIGLLVSPLRIVVADISRMADEGIRLLMYLTPILYSPKLEIGILSDLVAMNPLTYLIGFPRDLLTNGTFFAPFYFGFFAVLSIVFFLIAFRIFQITEPRIRERLIAN
ncbi:ABC transporter permease [Neolewinella aurantiaca]|uniref:ABC transporter permease n=1 Tax=Neolewinella aurantiaca TaxID=2602767 RepID=UPI001650B351|nr:ABC transporter permease [Neolewinella aurantiaca]